MTRNHKGVGVEPGVQSTDTSSSPKKRIIGVMQRFKHFFFFFFLMLDYVDIVSKRQQVLWAHWRVLPPHMKRRNTVLHRHQPTDAPRLRVVSIPPVGTKTSGTLFKMLREARKERSVFLHFQAAHWRIGTMNNRVLIKLRA